MKGKILALLAEKFNEARKDGLSILADSLSLTINTEEDAKKVVDELTADKINNFISVFRKNADAESKKAIETAEANLRKKYKFVDLNEEKQPKPGNNEQPDIKALIAEAVKPYADELQQMKKNGEKNSRREKFTAAISNAPESIKNLYIDNFNAKEFENDEDFDKYLADAAAKVDSIAKEINANNLKNFGAPSRGNGSLDGVSAGAKAYIESKNAKK